MILANTEELQFMNITFFFPPKVSLLKKTPTLIQAKGPAVLSKKHTFYPDGFRLSYTSPDDS